MTAPEHHTIPLGEAQAGMVLAAPVCGADAGILLTGGIALTDGMIASLHKRGVTDIIVLAEAGNSAASIARVDETLARIFRHATGQTSLERLRRLAREIMLEPAK